jgi:nitroreductase
MENTGPFEALVRRRRSIRKYQDKPVEREKILKCLEAARLAPSAENTQPWRFVVLDDPELRERVGRRAFSGIYFTTRWALKAPVLIVILAKLDVITNKIGAFLQNCQFYLLDIGCAVQQVALQALEMDIGTCWIGWFNNKKVKHELKIPDKYHVVAMLSMGYIERWPRHEKPRKAIEEIAWFNEVK